MTNLENADQAIDLYLQHMKIELMFRDLESEMGIDKNMSLQRENMQKLIVLPMLAYTMAVLVGEKIREQYYALKKGRAIAASLVFLVLRCQWCKLVKLSQIDAWLEEASRAMIWTKPVRTPDPGEFKHIPLTNVQVNLLLTEVSKYATRNPLEFVAEMYAGNKAGHKFSDDIMRLFAYFGGVQ